MLTALITVAFLSAYALLIGFYYLQWKKIKDFSGPLNPVKPVFASVVIAARNEEKNLPLLLADLAGQSYPQQWFEVMVVNDFSTDNTAKVKEPRLANLKMIEPPLHAEASSKKAAIAAGVAEAKGEIILITDADCRVGPKWISTLVSFYQKTNAAFIAAPVKYQPNNSLLHIFQTLDFITLQGITAASVSAGFHNMCNGANLAYTKKAFTEVKGFEAIDHVASGDDMLLMHKIWQQYPQAVHYLRSKEAIVSTRPAASWKAFFAQRRRWASKTLVYRDWRILLVLAFVLMLNLWFLFLIAATFIHPQNAWLLLSFIVVKPLIEFPFVFSVARFFSQQNLMPYFVLLQPLHIFYTVVVGIFSQFGKYEWKGRRLK